MALQLSRTDPEIGATFTTAYGRVNDAQIFLGALRGHVDLSWFVDADAYHTNKQPFATDPLDLTADEIGAVIDQFRAALYQLIKSRAGYTDALDV
jgi:hypothetical protein